MTELQFIDSVLEHLFVGGLNCPNLPLLSMYVGMERERLGAWPEPRSFAARCLEFPGVTNQPTLPNGGESPSPAAGARDKWPAVHEAGHAIVGVLAGLTLRGIRFYGDGFPGETGFEEVE